MAVGSLQPTDETRPLSGHLRPSERPLRLHPEHRAQITGMPPWRLEATTLGIALAGSLAIGALVAVVREAANALQNAALGASLESVGGLVGLYVDWRLLLVTTTGGLVVGVAAYAIRRWRRSEVIDPIEANAIHGGRMSVADSLLLVALCILSVGVGGSVGLEAAVTQLGAGLLSFTGQRLALPRGSLRSLVAAGAGAGIAAIFQAPLTGILYALELVAGGYAVRSAGPILVAGLASAASTWLIFGRLPLFALPQPPTTVGLDSLLMAVVGMAAAGLAVLVMRGATGVDGLLTRLRFPHPLRPMLGGLALGFIALASPGVLGSGHGAIRTVLDLEVAGSALLLLLVAKAFAAAISVGSGFRGGLFSTSLFLGATLGAALGLAVQDLFPTLAIDPRSVAIASMAATAAVVVGAPIAAILLVFETTTDYGDLVGIGLAVVVATVLGRRWFGYSFATWRFHVRGLDLRSAYDVGRLWELKVADVAWPPHDTAGGSDATASRAATALTVAPDDRLLPVLDRLEAAHAETATVVDPTGRALGLLREAPALRRVLDEVEAMQREDLGARPWMDWRPPDLRPGPTAADSRPAGENPVKFPNA
jgi:CIC family chloride channel protein